MRGRRPRPPRPCRTAAGLVQLVQRQPRRRVRHEAAQVHARLFARVVDRRRDTPAGAGPPGRSSLRGTRGSSPSRRGAGPTSGGPAARPAAGRNRPRSSPRRPARTCPMTLWSTKNRTLRPQAPAGSGAAGGSSRNWSRSPRRTAAGRSGSSPPCRCGTVSFCSPLASGWTNEHSIEHSRTTTFCRGRTSLRRLARVLVGQRLDQDVGELLLDVLGHGVDEPQSISPAGLPSSSSTARHFAHWQWPCQSFWLIEISRRLGICRGAAPWRCGSAPCASRRSSGRAARRRASACRRSGCTTRDAPAKYFSGGKQRVEGVDEHGETVVPAVLGRDRAGIAVELRPRRRTAR